MRAKTALTSIALIAGMTFSGAAYAATINGMEVPASDMEAVQARCAELNATATAPESISTELESDGDDNIDANAAAGGGAVTAMEDDTKDDGAATDNTASVGEFDMDSLTAESCAEFSAQ